MMDTAFNRKVQGEFEEALDKIKKFTGLELMLSEKVALRRMVVEVLEGDQRTTIPENIGAISSGALYLFLEKYYDLSLPDQCAASKFMRLKRQVNLEKGYDAISEFFWVMQDRAYLI